MIKICHTLAAWSGLFFAVMFLFLNIKYITEGVGYIYLALSVASAGLILVIRMNHGTTLAIRKSALWLLIFLAYFVTKAFWDFPDFSEIKAITVGTTGGLIFALIFGVIVSILLQTLFTLQQSWFSLPLPALLFYWLCLILAVIAFREHAGFLRNDIFLIENSDGMYQRPANFIIIIYLIASVILAQITINRSKVKFYNLLFRTILIIYFLLIAPLLLTAQLIGSNTGFVVTLGLGGSTAIWLLLKETGFFKKNIDKWTRRFSGIFIIQKSLPIISTYVLAIVFLIGMICLFFFTKLNMDTSAFRIFGFGSEELGGKSLSSRLDILSESFLNQFLYDPIFGNLDVDTVTTGTGYYAHSLLSMLSHLGIIGTSLFSAYLIGIYRELKIANTWPNTDWESVEAKIFRILAFAVILGFALIGTFFTWMPLWFALGLLFPPIILRSNQSLRNGKSRIISRRSALHV